MKKITLLLMFVLISATAFSQADSADGTADVTAQIVSPIQITDGSALNFGSINGTATGGDVTVSPAGARSFTNTAMAITTATPITAAKFNITAANGFSYKIDIPATTLTGTGTPMGITFDHDRADTGNIGSGSAQELNVGGTLTVGDGQTSGAYSGTVTVTVSYE
ncbi:DUF4402 domain-containing protein [Christiangramia aquimixticola]|uniref:DUF4402 domain-containing protein n=1 Tax=Christiangramia aquimixticola TaxID=1697558 RepID=UPI003AA81E8B